MNPVAEGKTKRLFPDTVIVEGKNIVTWGNLHQAAMPGKAEWSTTTTVNVFKLFQKHNLPVAFI